MLKFRQATESDCQLIQSLASQTWEDTYKNILTKAQLDYMFEMMYSIENIKKQMNLQNFYVNDSNDEEEYGSDLIAYNR